MKRGAVKQLLIATNNDHKFAEFKSTIGRFGLPLRLLYAKDVGLEDFPPEVGSSYEENAFVKAAYAAAKTGLPSLGDDSGLEVAALGGEPGLYSARYGGDISQGERLVKLLKAVQNVPQKARGAKFVCALAFATPAGNVQTFRGECHGELLQGPRGDGGFGYDPIFYSYDLNTSFAEADKSEFDKECVSHRGRALLAFANWLMNPPSSQD